MKIVKIILSILTIIFAALGLLKVLSFDIASPIMLLLLGTLIILRGFEYKEKNDRSGFILSIMTALFVYFVVIYNLFIW